MIIKPPPRQHSGTLSGLPEKKSWAWIPEITTSASWKTAWENPTLGCLGPGLGSVAERHGSDPVHFQQVGGLECKPVLGEDHHGLERLAMYIQGVDSVFDLVWSDDPGWARPPTATCSHQNRGGAITYNFEHADVEFPVPAEHVQEGPESAGTGKTAAAACLRAHPRAAPPSTLLDARKAISVTEGVSATSCAFALTKAVAGHTYASAKLRFPRVSSAVRTKQVRNGHGTITFLVRSVLLSCRPKPCAPLAKPLPTTKAELTKADLAFGARQVDYAGTGVRRLLVRQSWAGERTEL